MKPSVRHLAVTLAAWLLAASQAWAQAWPAKPLSMAKPQTRQAFGSSDKLGVAPLANLDRSVPHRDCALPGDCPVDSSATPAMILALQQNHPWSPHV